MLSVLRLVKGLFTFEGGFDYVLWKIERHSGVRVEVSPRARRYPLLAGWGVIWRRLWLDRDIDDHETWLARRPRSQ